MYNQKNLARTKRHDIEVVVDRLRVGERVRARLTESIEAAPTITKARFTYPQKGKTVTITVEEIDYRERIPERIFFTDRLPLGQSRGR